MGFYNFLFIAPAMVLSVILVYMTKYKSKKVKNIVIISLASLFFLSYFPNLLSKDVIDYAVNFNGIFSKNKAIFMQTLRTFTLASYFIVSLLPFTKNKGMGNLVVLFVLPVSVLNLGLIDFNLEAMNGLNFSYLSRQAIFFGIQQALAITMAMYIIFANTNRTDFKDYKRLLKNILITLPFIILLGVPTSTFQMFFGLTGHRLVNFGDYHRIALVLTFALIPTMYFVLRKKSYDVRYLAVLFIALSGFVHFYRLYSWPFTWSALPAHLCNAAMLLIPVSLALKSKKVFYFTYFFNTIGALIALIIPNTSGDMFLNSNVHFWYEHIIAFYLPILVVAIGVMPRPKFKEYKWALFVFTIYFMIVLALNAYVSNFNPNIDYFFLNSDFLVTKFMWARPLRENYVSVFTYKDLTFTIYPMYQALIFVGFVFFTLILWTIYDYGYKVADSLGDLFSKKKLDQLDVLEFRKEMDGRNISEPINLGGINMLKIENLTKQYASSDVKALNDFSLTVKEGEVFGFLGHNGAGKSTAIKSIVGILPITSGSVEIFGYDVARQPLEAKRLVGYVPDNHAVYERLTGREYVNYVADLYHVSLEDRKERFDKYVKMFGLERAIDNQIKTYSHGMKQKVTVIAALIHNPRLWVLDEPLTGLDPTSAYQVKESMRRHADEGNIVFFSSHVIDVVEKVCDRIAIISHGELVCVKDLKEMRENGESLEELFLEIVEGSKDVL